jgi:RNA polymerase sigma-70 factor (ECF subfamily)
MAAVLDFSGLQGDQPEPLASLHARFAGPLKRFFRSYRLNAADVDDLTQDVFMRVAGRRGRATLLKPEAFLFTLAKNLVRDRARRLHIRAAAHSIAVDDDDLRCERPTPDQWLDLAQRIEQVQAAVAALKPRTREAFLLHRVNGDSYAAIATQMEISVSMVEKHIMCAMTALRAVKVE